MDCTFIGHRLQYCGVVMQDPGTLYFMRQLRRFLQIYVIKERKYEWIVRSKDIDYNIMEWSCKKLMLFIFYYTFTQSLVDLVNRRKQI